MALSTGASFGSPSSWLTGLGAGNTDHFMADVNGDLMADAIIFNEKYNII